MTRPGGSAARAQLAMWLRADLKAALQERAERDGVPMRQVLEAALDSYLGGATNEGGQHGSAEAE